MKKGEIITAADALGKIKIFAIKDGDLKGKLLRIFQKFARIRKDFVEERASIVEKLNADVPLDAENRKTAEAEAQKSVNEILKEEVTIEYEKIALNDILKIGQDDLTLEDIDDLAPIIE